MVLLLGIHWQMQISFDTPLQNIVMWEVQADSEAFKIHMPGPFF